MLECSQMTTKTDFGSIQKTIECSPAIVSRVINTLTENKVQIFTKIHQRTSSVAKYPTIMQMYREEGCLSDAFQREYKTFYRLNTVGLTDEQKQRYFELMSNRAIRLEVILNELYKLPTRKNTHSIQFSFATKLLHTLDVNQPIYDSNVGTMFNLKVVGNTKEQKIRSCLEIYNFLKSTYRSMLSDGKVRSLISAFREEFGYDENDISDTKVLDFLIWAGK